MHRDDDLGLQLFNDLFPSLRPDGENPPDDLKKDIYMTDELKLVFVERFTKILTYFSVHGL